MVIGGVCNGSLPFTTLSYLTRYLYAYTYAIMPYDYLCLFGLSIVYKVGTVLVTISGIHTC